MNDPVAEQLKMALRKRNETILQMKALIKDQIERLKLEDAMAAVKRD